MCFSCTLKGSSNLGIGLDTTTLTSCSMLIFVQHLHFIIATTKNPALVNLMSLKGMQVIKCLSCELLQAGNCLWSIDVEDHSVSFENVKYLGAFASFL